MKSGFRIAALALAALSISPCAGVIGEMQAEDVSDYPAQYCAGGEFYQFSGTLIHTNARYTAMFNYPMIFHSLMCHLQHYCEPDYNDMDDCTGRNFPGCAPYDVRGESAWTFIPTLTNRNIAVTQLARFFEDGGTTNRGAFTISPLMHAYGGSPLCVWPASNVTDVTVQQADYATVPGATPLKAGAGRGGCFDAVGWLACTNAADRPYGFHVQTRHPMEDLGNYIYQTLAPYFSVDWASNGIPTPATLGSYPNSFFLTNSPAYVSAEAVPTNETRRTFRIEPWRRSWEALGGLACIAWRLNCNPFEYAAHDQRRMGTLSASSSNDVVMAMTTYMEAGHPAIDNTIFFPTNGRGVVRTQYYGPQGRDMESVRPSGDFEPAYILPRGTYQPQTGLPISPDDWTYNWTVTNFNARTLDAPVSNVTLYVTNKLFATSEKRWKFKKVNEVDGGRTILTNGVARMDFGYDPHDYNFEWLEYGPSSYEWEVDEEYQPVTHVEISASTNIAHTVLSATFTATNQSWMGFTLSWDGFDIPHRASTVATYADAGMGSIYFLASVNAGFLQAIADDDPPLDADEMSASVYQLARQPQPMLEGSPPWWDTIWTGAGHEYTITTHGPPPPYHRDHGTNLMYYAQYDTTNAVTQEVTSWRDIIHCDVETNVIARCHQRMPDGPQEWDFPDGGSYGGYVPIDEGDAVSKIRFTIENITGSEYHIQWDPVRAWGIFPGVTNHADWPE